MRWKSSTGGSERSLSERTASVRVPQEEQLKRLSPSSLSSATRSRRLSTSPGKPFTFNSNS